jgi:hypothetical protein
MRSLRGTIVSQVRELAARTKCSTVSGRGSAIAHEGTYSTTDTEPLSQLSELWANLEEQKVERQVLLRGASLISQNCESRPRAFRYRRPCSSNLTAQDVGRDQSLHRLASVAAAGGDGRVGDRVQLDGRWRRSFGRSGRTGQLLVARTVGSHVLECKTACTSMGILSASPGASCTQADLLVKSGWAHRTLLCARNYQPCAEKVEGLSKKDVFHAHLRRRDHRLGPHGKLGAPCAFGQGR